MTQPRPFVFDTEFDAAGGVVASRPTQTVKRVYLAAEVEALVAQARAEARQQSMSELEGVQAMALAEIGQALGRALPGLARVAHEHRAASAELALAAARIIAGSALAQTPQGPLHEALEALGHEIDATPRLVVRTGGLSDDARLRIEAVCAEAGFTGQVSFREDPGMDAAAFALEWADGRAEYSPEDSARRVGEALTAALAAEGGHAETLIIPEGDG
ncbi:MAG: flagellar assembly protein FlbE [Brevundimonas sp.]|uniref:flagellar assembly protein FlbE n=1 Tax=Brevundimonas sp. TaxID=1871086 RepID=UPI00391CA32C